MQRSLRDTFSGLIDLWVRGRDNCDDRRISDVQLLSRTSVKREPRSRPTKNHVANLTPLRSLRYFNNNHARFIASRILKRDVQITVCFNFESSDAICERVPVILNPGAL
jgi:hypothetical protein